MQKKKDNLTRTVSTGVLTNSVFCVSLNFKISENTIKIGASAKTQKQKKN